MNRRGFFGRVVGALAAAKLAPVVKTEDVVAAPVKVYYPPEGKGDIISSGWISTKHRGHIEKAWQERIDADRGEP